ncbi:MAG: alpha/beta fold hydrolase [Egibacteraceae bacterium]
MALLSVLSVGWYYAGEILRPPQAERPVYDVTVADVGETTVTVPAAAVPDGVWGLQWPEGYARVGEVVGTDPDAGTVTRRMVPVIGALQAGQAVAVDAHAYPPDAADAFAFPAETVLLAGPDGPLPADVVVPEVTAPDDERTAWRAGPRDTWVIMVHGRGGSRSEAFRALPTIRALGLPALVLGYRNDPDAPASPDGHSGLGWTEWRDVQAATDYAFDHGARDVVLLGYSMGGAIVSTYLHEAPDADRVAGMVLDAPVLDWDVVLRAAAADRGVPLWLIPVARGIITVRTGLRWGRLDQVARAEDFDVPILLFHGTADPTVPVASSDAFAAARPDLVTYVRVEGAGHVRAWNADPDAYEAHLRDFLLTTVGR